MVIDENESSEEVKNIHDHEAPRMKSKHLSVGISKKKSYTLLM